MCRPFGRRRRLVAGTALAVAASFLAVSRPALAARAPLGPYRGLASWVDIYDAQLWVDPEATIAAMRAEGVRTLFLETSNYSHRAIVYPILTGRFIDAAHAAGMDIVAWYLPSFVRVAKDLRNATAAIDYRSATGQSFDSFALDIESRAVANARRRTRRLLHLSEMISRRVRPRYPLAAIVPNPVRLAEPDSFWPSFPYRELARQFDVFAPMCYSGSDAQGEGATFSYASGCIDLVLAGTGDQRIPIHLIGGIANNLNAAEIHAFVHAVRSHDILGGSLYDFATTARRAWTQLRRIR